MSKAKRNRLAGYVRQLSSLHVNSAVTIPMTVAALRELVGADWAGFVWADRHGEPSALHCENPGVFETWPRFDELRRSGEIGRLCGGDFQDWMRLRAPPPNSANLDKQAWLSSGFYNEVVRPTGTQHFCTTVVHEDGYGLGNTVLGRSTQARPFSPADQQLISYFTTHLAHAVTHPSQATADYLNSELSAVLLVDTSGRVLHRSPHAVRLLRMACDDTLLGDPGITSPSVTRDLADCLLSLRKSQPGPPPVRRVTNRWGRFVWRAYPMSSNEGFMLLHVQHELPRLAAFAHGSYVLGLSAQQQAVAVRLASGLPYRHIAQDLQVKESTVIDHARKLYVKLGVHDMQQLANHLVEACLPAQGSCAGR